MGETTLETSGEDVKLHSKRVEKMRKTTLETSGEDEQKACTELEQLIKGQDISSNLPT